MDIITEIQRQLDADQPELALSDAAEYFKMTKDPHRLFEVRKMQSRLRLGLPIVSWQSLEELEATNRVALESELLAACQEVGLLSLENGDLGRAWNYLEPLEDRAWVLEQLTATPITDTNLDQAIEIALHRGVHPVWGMQLILEHYGTCNAITMFDSSAAYLPQLVKVSLAEELIQHFYGELLQNMGSNPRSLAVDDQAFSQSVLSQDASENGGAPHIDATHLHSVTRIGRITIQNRILKMLLSLCYYGERLGEMFQFAGEPPFESHYRDLALFYSGLLDMDRAAAIKHFESKLAESIGQPHHLLVAETIVDWLARMGEIDRAIEIATSYSDDDFGQLSIAPNLVELATRGQVSLAPLKSRLLKDGDVLRYLMTALIRQQ